jgi:adenylylsulfate kinase
MDITKKNTISTRQNKEINLKQKSKVIWFTGLPCSGKTTLSVNLEEYLIENNFTTIIIDGDFIRNSLNKDLDFSINARYENVRRVAELSKLLIDNGIIVIVCLISPLRELRKMAEDIIGKEDFIEIYVNAPLAVCENRDVKGMYKKARAGEIKQFTGVDSIYEAPLNPSLEILTKDNSITDSVGVLINFLVPLLK